MSFNNNNNNKIANKTLEHQYTHTSFQEQLLKERAHSIRLLILDVDGVMTDGSLYYEDTGLCMKRFNVLDGIGIRLAKEAGLSIAIVSGMDVPCVERRLKDLGISDYHPGINNKHAHIDKLRTQKNLQWPLFLSAHFVLRLFPHTALFVQCVFSLFHFPYMTQAVPVFYQIQAF